MTDDLHDLDNRLKKSAEDFSLSPSPGVWKNVEREIRGRERKRKFLLFFWPGLVLLAGGSAWLVFRPVDPQRAEVSENVRPVETTLPAPNGPDETKTMPGQPGKPNASSPAASAPAAIPLTDQPASDRQQPASTNRSAVQRSSPVQFPGNATAETKRSAATVMIAEEKRSADVSSSQSKQGSVVLVESAKTETSASAASSAPTILPAVTDSVKLVASTPAPQQHDSVPGPMLSATNRDSLPAPESAASPPSVHRWSVGFGPAPAMSFTTFSDAGDHELIVDYRNATDKDLPALNAHLDLSYTLSPRFEIYSGLSLVSYRERMRARQVVYYYDSIPVSGPAPPPNWTYQYLPTDCTGFVVNRFNYIGVPLGMRCNVLRFSKFGIWLQPEVSANRIIRAKGRIYDEDILVYRRIERADMQPWKFAYGLGIVFRWNPREDLAFEVTPAFRDFPGSVYRPSFSVQQQFAQAEVRFALRYRFPE